MTCMALAAAFAAMNDARLTPEDMRSAGLILASGYGPVQMTFSFLDSLRTMARIWRRPCPFHFPCTICRLASDAASYITGQVISVNGGLFTG